MDNMQSLGGGLWYDPDTDTIFDETTGGVVNFTGGGAAAPDNVELVNQAQTAAEGGWLDSFSDGLLKIGTTASQLAMLYQNVQSSRQLTPVALQNLQAERAYLQTQTQSSQTMWMWVALAAAAGLVLMRGRSN